MTRWSIAIARLVAELRWKLWEWASWLAWWVCPDKKALGLVQRHGTEFSRWALTQSRAERARRE